MKRVLNVSKNFV